MMLDTIGWVATAVFTSSYFFTRSLTLRRIQAVAALIWVAYGLMLGAKPVVAANVLVAGTAIFSSVAEARRKNASPLQ
jgi:small basic protein